MSLSEPIALDLELRAFVYRLWNADGACMYVGQHRGIHPAVRINQHRSQPWFGEVDHADFVEILDGDLDIAEKQMIADLEPRYNNGGYYGLHPRAPLPPEDVRAPHDDEDLLFRDFLLRLLEENLGADLWALVKARSEAAGRRAERVMTDSVLDPRTHPVSFDITQPPQQVIARALAEPAADRLRQRLDDLEHRLDILQGILADLLEDS